jgi:His-Xaa-Ser system radical SAM maturase HxsB
MKGGSIELPVISVAEKGLGFFRFGRLAGKVLLTNDAGEWHFLEEGTFRELLEGRIGPSHAEYGELVAKSFILAGQSLGPLAAAIARKKWHVGSGPHLHIVITTLRCNQTCTYCHASRAPMNRTDTDMTEETARRVVDSVFQSASPTITFEFQGGEPTLNFPAIRRVVEEARARNRVAGKRLFFTLVTNMSSMTEEKARWLVENDVRLCTSLDGPEELHNGNRTWTGGNAFDETLRWMRFFNARYAELGRDPKIWHVDALMTTTRRSFGLHREIVDLYVGLGLQSLHVRPLSPFGFARDTWNVIGYSVDEYLAFYRAVLDEVIERNRQGIQILERTASIFLRKILTPDDPGYVDIQSPCGAGTGQVAYNYDGSVFPCDEARMVDAGGDSIFRLGMAGQMGPDELPRHPTVRALGAASLLDALPMCSSCWNLPYCGVCPLHSYMTGGDLFGLRPESPKCKEHLAIVSGLFERLVGPEGPEIEPIFRRWTIQLPQAETRREIQEEVA